MPINNSSSAGRACRSGGLEGGYGDFGRAVEAEGNAYGADAAVDVELGRAEQVMAFRIEPAEGRERERAKAGDADLTAVGVAGEDKIHVAAAVVGDDVVGVVGLMGHQEYGCVGISGQGEREVGVAFGDVVDAAEEEMGAPALDAYVLVDEQRKSVVLHVVADDARADDDIVIAEDSVALGAGEGAEQGGAAGGGGERDIDRERAAADEVAGDEEEVGGKGVDPADDVAEEKLFGVLLEVDVGELDDAEAVERRGQVADGESAVGDLDIVAGGLVGVEADGRGCEGGGREEGSASQVSRLGRGGKTLHSP